MLREELTDEYEADKQAALTQLSQQKELEMMAAREGWQRKVEDLLEQVKRMGKTVLAPAFKKVTLPAQHLPLYLPFYFFFVYRKPLVNCARSH